METGTIAALLGALGAGGIITKLIEGIWGWRSGRMGREQDAWGQRDREAKARRILEEYAHKLRRLLQRHDIEPPDWPDYHTHD